MKIIHLFAVLGVFAAVSLTPVPAPAAAGDGVALAIVYDTSGSMRDEVRDRAGNPTPKYVIANRALVNIATRIQAFATNSTTGAPRNIQAGLFIFDGSNVKQAVPFGPFDAAAYKDWARKFSSPDGGTPLGNALAVAGKTVLNSGLARKHVLIITDGMNTAGPTPAEVMPRLKQQAQEKQRPPCPCTSSPSTWMPKFSMRSRSSARRWSAPRMKSSSTRNWSLSCSARFSSKKKNRKEAVNQRKETYV